jgi:sterol desaturase/sphingolipid hydroxylase (fatty acid hydroxylase superfamily)
MALIGADPIPFDNLDAVSHPATNLILWAVPVMLFFTALEYYFAWKERKKFYETQELLGSIGVGLGNLFVSAALKMVFLYGVIVVYNFVPWRMELQWWTIAPAYIIFDFFSYWAHRISHEQRFWWATHVVHHSGEHYNLAVSFRLSWVQHLKVLFFLPVVFMAFHPVVFFVTNQLAVLFQFWVHTEYIRKMHPVLEYIFATPSNHRVHHGSQEKYLDKNYGATFIIWDRMFGTFQPEEEQVKYGLTAPIPNKANPFYINFHEYIDIIQDIKSAPTFRQKWYYLFGSPAKIALEKKNKSTISKTQEAPLNL